ncbi:hypothetical protein ILYODFUR_012236 [Ilyodon furcidens]|uniref:Uncharacterized protein n=1 Tax=Ilyodon furcidens TaxID=33524 RepID=A0ABV0SLH0_9TELE
MRGSCLTQNGAWFKSQKERGNHTVRLRELYRSPRTHLSSLSPGLGFFFQSLFAPSFVFTAGTLLPFLPAHLFCHPSTPLPSSSFHPALVDFGHHQPPPTGTDSGLQQPAGF